MREIEIKARLEDKHAVIGLLEVRGVELSSPITQRDQVFGLPNVDGGDNTKGAADSYGNKRR